MVRRAAGTLLIAMICAIAAGAQAQNTAAKTPPQSADQKPATPSQPATSVERTEGTPGVAIDDEQLLEQASEGDATSATAPRSSARRMPRPVFDVNGYFRVRAEWQKRFFLNRTNGLPFERFVPGDRDANCSAPPPTGNTDCGSGKGVLGYANMRFRLDPTISITDDIQIHSRIDVFDNYVLGSAPQPAAIPTNDTLDRGDGLSNDPKDTIRVRRLWAEVTNRSIGQLRFGRMPNHWGLGMVYNGGDGIDSDYESDIDRIQAITRFRSVYFGVSWDFPSSGAIFDPTSENTGIPFDLAQKDDVKQWSFMVAYRRDDDEREHRLKSGKWITETGVYFVLRSQKISFSDTAGTAMEPDPPPANDNLEFFQRNAKVFVPDLWFLARRNNMRIELEFAYVAGRVDTSSVDAAPTAANQVGNFHLRQLGYALEFEFRPTKAKDKLGLFFNHGLASGDQEVDGLSAYENTLNQGTSGSRKLSHFAFHPNYRIDLILFRNILGQIGGAWYLAHGVSYDILHNAFGQRLGGRFDIIYARAVKSAQTYGGNPNLGTELDFSFYYQSEGGANALDGYFIQAQYGVLFAMKGLGFTSRTDPFFVNTSHAQTMRLLLGVRF